jgi:glycosyltransferase involved in cell wall biosynthesis
MPFTPKVSIVIPVYNGSDYLREAIDSSLAQTYPNLEIVVVNDGSRDDGATERIARSYGDKIRYFSKENGGVASALNTAIDKMSGEYFSWLSHDDLYTPNKVEAQVGALANLEDRERVIAYSDFAVFTDDPNRVREVHLPDVSPESFRYFLAADSVLHGCTLLIPKRAFDECGIFNEKLRTTQDYELWFRFSEKFRFMRVPAVLVKGRHHENQGTNRMKATVLAECNALLIDFLRKLSLAELKAATHRSPGFAYAELSTSCARRGFYAAARHAAALSVRSWGQGPVRDAAVSASILARSALRGVLRTAVNRLRFLAKDVIAGIKKVRGQSEPGGSK